MYINSRSFAMTPPLELSFTLMINLFCICKALEVFKQMQMRGGKFVHVAIEPEFLGKKRGKHCKAQFLCFTMRVYCCRPCRGGKSIGERHENGKEKTMIENTG
jgi:hypothetical protein